MPPCDSSVNQWPQLPERAIDDQDYHAILFHWGSSELLDTFTQTIIRVLRSIASAAVSTSPGFKQNSDGVYLKIGVGHRES